MAERNLKEKIKQLSLELREIQRLMKEWRDEYIVVFAAETLKPPPLPAKAFPPDADALKRLRELEEREEKLLQQLEDLYKST